ncbi:RNA methyltransferase [Candidatus Woesearchaeota archaeon CG_4_10_14_0_8_um_filter_47_5]|nr:MAG: RNA methyltransferase [Candidatus Woesearchaeota archaeon CG_4_10_14_0_8_um_filter_47_5]
MPYSPHPSVPSLSPISKSQLAIVLSQLKPFSNPKIHLEQYTTDAEIAADVLWNAFMLRDIRDKTVADFGCGTGTIGIGALLLGARHIWFVDIDETLPAIISENILHAQELSGIALGADTRDAGRYTIVVSDIQDVSLTNFDQPVETIIQNPPFGIQKKHADQKFLEKALSLAPAVYSFHTHDSLPFVKTLAQKHACALTHFWFYPFPLKKSYSFHTKKRVQKKIVVCRLAHSA